MKAGIIAAGEGSRFRAAGLLTPKPLLTISGETLLERTVRLLAEGGIEEIVIIVNQTMPQVVDKVRSLQLSVPLSVVVKSTESSMHSLYEIFPLLSEKGPFVLCTIDSIIRRQEVFGFFERFVRSASIDLLLAYTDFIDDEKPLHIALRDDERVISIGEQAKKSPFVTAGLYGMSSQIWPQLERCINRGQTRLRTFLGAVVQSSANVYGYRLSKAIDVDRPIDICTAEDFLQREII